MSVVEITTSLNVVGCAISIEGSNNWAQPSIVSLTHEIIPHVLIPPVATPLNVRIPLKTAIRYLIN